MRNNKFLQSTLILIIGGMITKVLGFVIKIIYTRIIGEQGVALYTLVMPTYSLLLTIAQLGLPVAISKLVAEEKRSSQRIAFSIIPVMIILNVVVILAIIFCSPLIATYLLNKSEAQYLIVAMALTLPFVSMTSILKGYFYGKQRMIPHTIANVSEQIVRLILIILVLPALIKVNILTAIVGMILLNIIAEIAQGTAFMFFLPKKWKIHKDEIKPDVSTVKDVMSLSLPTTSSRFIGNIGYFFEPIILTQLLLFSGYSSDFIIMEYGAFNAYALQTLLLPSFFIAAISSALIPEISKFQAAGNNDMVKRRFKQAMLISFVLGLFFSIAIFFFADNLLMILYNTSAGTNYMKVLIPFFVLFYLEGPLISMLQAIGKADVTMKITFWGMLLKLAVLAIGSLCHIGIYGLVISEIVNIIFVVVLNYKEIKKYI